MRGPKGVEGRSGVFYFLERDDFVAFLVLYHDGRSVFVQFLLQCLAALGEHPVHAIAHAGRDVDVLEQGKVGQSYLERVGHAGGHALQEFGSQRIPKLLNPVSASRSIDVRHVIAVGIHHKVLQIPHFEAHPVLEGGGITQGNLLIKLFLAHAVLLLERIETGDGKSDVGQGEGIAGVPGILVVQGVHAQVELAVPVMGIGDGGTHLVLLGLRNRTGVILAVGRAGEVHRCAERGSRMSLGILRMGPSEAEVLGLDKVRAAFFSRLVVGKAEGQCAVELVIDFIAGVHVYRP